MYKDWLVKKVIQNGLQRILFEISFGNTSRPFKHCPYKQFKVHVNVGQQHGASLFIRKDYLENYLFTRHENYK